MESYILKAVSVAALSAVKYIFGFFAALANGFTIFELLLFNFGGGIAGLLVFLYLWEKMVLLFRKIFPAKQKKEKQKKNRPRWISRIIKKYDLYGVAFLTPLLSVPLGVILASSLTSDKRRIRRYISVSFLAWTIFLYGIYSLSGIRPDQWL
jgi:hypothetical protein